MKVWLAMTYACHGKPRRFGVRTEPQLVEAMLAGDEGCGFEETIYCGLGVEGPPAQREEGRYIPSPFYGRRCPVCGGDTAHVRWNEDRRIDPPIEAPSGSRVFACADLDAALRRVEREGGTMFVGQVVEVP